jgi:hypothetical protein
MKRKTFPILAALLLAAVFSFDACKKADVETGIVTVIVSAGVSGNPDAGTYIVNVGDQWAYSYALDAGYAKLTVLLDGAEVAASGFLKVSGNHTLKAYSDENGQYNLTVTVGTGVSGTPAAGTFTYPQGTLVNYSYALAEGYTAISIKLDGAEVESQGTITMSAAHTLSVSAVVKYNVQGAWAFLETYDDGSSFNVTTTFSGNYVGGTVNDSDGGSGAYTYDDDTVEFTIDFPDVTYEYSGSFSDADTMSGTCKRYQTSASIISGTWIATRKTTGAAVLGLNTRAIDIGKKGAMGQPKNQ